MKKLLFIIALTFVFHATVLAQGPPPPPPPPGPLGGGGTSVPLDNEVVFLLIAAVAFGVFKLQNRKIAD
ncbi:MAG: hypothetical protein AB7G44_01180 [Bacteroidia bacterium]